MFAVAISRARYLPLTAETSVVGKSWKLVMRKMAMMREWVSTGTGSAREAAASCYLRVLWPIWLELMPALAMRGELEWRKKRKPMMRRLLAGPGAGLLSRAWREDWAIEPFAPKIEQPVDRLAKVKMWLERMASSNGPQA